MMYPEYGSLKSGHQAHFYGRMCAKSSCIWQCRGRHLVLAAASPNAVPGLSFSGFGCNTKNGPQIAGFGASRAAKNVVASPRHHICPRPLMAFASSNVFRHHEDTASFGTGEPISSQGTSDPLRTHKKPII